MDTVSMDIAALKLSSTANCAPGTVVWNWANQRQFPETFVCLVPMDADDSRSYFLCLTGPEAFTIRVFTRPRAWPILECSNDRLQVSFEKSALAPNASASKGSILLTADGAYLMVGMNLGGFEDLYYVSLNDWTITSALNVNDPMYVNAWNFETNRSALEVRFPIAQFAAPQR